MSLLLKESNQWREIFVFIGLLLFLGISLLLPSKIALILTAIVFGILAFLKPFQSLLFLVIYVSIRPILTEINDGLKLIGDLITIIVLIKLVISSKLNLKELLTFKWFEWAFFGFLAIGSISGFMNGISMGAIIFQIRTFIIMYLLYYTVSRTLLPKGWIVKFAWVTIGLGWLLSIHGLIEKLSLRQLLLPDYWKHTALSATNMVRIYGMPGNPNSLALIMMFGILAVIFLKYFYKDLSYKKLLNTSLVLFIGILILTFSRGTLISAFILVAIYFLFSRDFKLLKSLVLGFIAALILVYYPVLGGVKLVSYLGVEAPEGGTGGLGARFGETFDEQNIERMTSNGRIFYVKKGFEIFKDYPIQGSGFGTFGGAATISYGSPIYEDYGIDLSIYFENKIYSDNQYIQIIAETGTLGVLLFGAFLIGMLLLFWKDRKSKFGQFMIALWLSTCFSGFYYNIWELKVYTMFFFLILGVYAVQKQYYKQYKIEK